MSARGPSPFIRSALRQIRQTLPRFLSILIITALGVAFFAGLRLSGPYMQESANRYFAERNFMDIEVLSTLGFDEDDIAALRATPGVTDVFAAYSTDVMLDTGDGKLSIHLISLDEETDAINAPLLKEGRLPRASGECLAEPAYLEACGKQVGDTIVFQSGTDAPLTDTLTTTEFTIVGAAVSPLYVSEDHGSSNVGDGHTDYFFALLARDFTLEVATEAYVIAEKSEAFRLDERYLDDLAPVVDALKATGAIRGPERYNTLLAEGTAELEDARAEVADGYQELIDAQKELEDARKELDDGWSELADARAELDDGWSAYNAGAATASQRFAREQRRLDEGLAQYEEGLEQWQGGQTRYESGLAQLEPLRAGIAQLDEGIAQVDGAIAALDPANPAYAPTLAALEQQKAELLAKRGPLQAQLTAAQAELASSKALLDSTKAQLDEARAELDSGSAQLAAARASTRSELATAKRELLDGEEKYRSGQQELQDGEDSYTSGLAEFNDEQAEALIELADAEQEIADGQEKLDKLESPTWHVLDLSMNAGFASYKDESKQLDAIALVIPLLFFLIAALVSMTSMTRLVDSDRTIIGTYKALGYRTISIAARYLFYSISASLIGSVIGVLVGFNLFPPVIFSAFQMMFTIPPAPLLFSWPYALISGGIAVLCAAVPAFLVSLQTMREVPAESMRPFTPTKGKRTLLERFSFLWRHLSFLHKITIRNLFRYKKRLFMTILGVAGCTALMFTGFGLRDSLSTVGPKQFGEIHRYDVQIDFKQDAPQEQIDDFLARLDDTGALLSHTALYQEAVEVVSENTTKTALLTVPQ
ncbi:MAG: hypothetical protein LBU48_01755, partial [Coriobacteriales bacterium]|nr:hypothetical protein [Coriobacteriales bacterium]